METLRVGRASAYQLLVAPIRVGLGLALLVAAVRLGADPGSAGVAFAAGAFVVFVALLQDPRRRLLPQPCEPEPLPGAAHVETPLELVRAAVFPSTVGVTILAAVALGISQRVLAALLAGGLLGMGLAALLGGGILFLQERERRVALLSDRRTRRLYERPF